MPAKQKKRRSLSDLGEFALIDWIKEQAKYSSEVVCGIGDDTAVVLLNSRKYLLLTADMLVEDVHFTKKMGAKNIGRKAMSCNISDIAAMGGIPKYALISLGVPAKENLQFVQELMGGIMRQASRFGIGVVGGDTVRSQRIVINVSLAGEVEKKKLVKRSGARPHDKIFVTGPLGKSFGSGRHLKFTPRLEESRFLGNHVHPSAMIDLSDGLGMDLGHILKASGVGAVLFEKSLPRHKGATVQQALFDGEDFELLLTLSPSDALQLMKVSEGRYHFKEIGEITKEVGMVFISQDGKKRRLDQNAGYKHFC